MSPKKWVLKMDGIAPSKHTEDLAKPPRFKIFFVTLDKVSPAECLKRYCHYGLAKQPINTQSKLSSSFISSETKYSPISSK